MTDRFKPLLDRDTLRGTLSYEYAAFRDTPAENELLIRLRQWQARTTSGETQISAAFIQTFFHDIWGYVADGGGRPGFTLVEQYAVPLAGSGGGTGAADVALGYFDAARQPAQVLCEFKGIGAGLDKPQARKGSTRSPAQQAIDYLRFARRGTFDHEPVIARFAIVTDMNEFRLYWADQAPERYLRFEIVSTPDLFAPGVGMLDDGEPARFDRFLFHTLFRPGMLLSAFGRTRFERLIEQQGRGERKLEKDFYADYRAYREVIYAELKLQPLGGISNGRKLRLAQKIVDRFIFVMFCEDMGGRVGFPVRMLTDLLAIESRDRFFQPDSNRVWDRLRELFGHMNDGGHFGGDTIHRFNGGLFAPDPLIDAVRLPNRLFCIKGQAGGLADAFVDKRTLYYLAATYNYASEGDARNSIGLYTLGHIFEQSIVELEAREGEEEGRDTIATLSKRKRDGVYYTPEPIVRRIVDETIGPLFAQWRAAAGWPADGDPDRAAADAYWARLQAITVCDPACGSGAFLITALRYLTAEFRAVLDTRLRLGFDAQAMGDAQVMALLMANNLYGVDINPASVEITQLSLWLHTAMPAMPLSSLDATIKAGNSLVDERFYQREHLGLYDDAGTERIAAFDWWQRFPEVGARGGFDAVVGNPPYVKLQNFRAVHTDVADYLRHGIDASGDRYESTQTGNFDLYLPFVEKGLALLNPGGRMGYIAPNLWPTLQNGEGLRGLIHAGGHLERWLDFRAHQVFEEATIYTAIQIFTRARNAAFHVAFAPDGDMTKVDWTNPGGRIAYADLRPARGPWLLAPAPVRALAKRLATTCRRLDDPAVTRGIIVGIQTSADHIYHLERLGRDRYAWTPPKAGRVQPATVEVAIEDAIMKPLVSGREAKRLIDPATTTYLLFPYVAGTNLLLSPDIMARDFPLAWAWLGKFEGELRLREKYRLPADDGSCGPFDDDAWYRFGRSQNIEKQETPKLIVPRLVASLRLAIDPEGKAYCDNVDVGGVIPANVDDLAYLGAILASPTADFLFRWGSKPFRGEYLSANKQFIAPLPIPDASPADKVRVGGIARDLQAGYTRRVALAGGIADRLARAARTVQPYDWLLADVPSIAALELAAPAGLLRRDLQAWVDARHGEAVEAAVARVDALLRLDATLEASSDDGALGLAIDGTPAIGPAYVDAAAAPFLLAQWQAVALGFAVKGKGDAKRLVGALRTVALAAPPVIVEQVIERQAELAALTIRLREGEAALHAESARLFGLTGDERRLVENRR